jgi:hypothetical protein
LEYRVLRLYPFQFDSIAASISNQTMIIFLATFSNMFLFYSFLLLKRKIKNQHAIDFCTKVFLLACPRFLPWVKNVNSGTTRWEKKRLPLLLSASQKVTVKTYEPGESRIKEKYMLKKHDGIDKSGMSSFLSVFLFPC